MEKKEGAQKSFKSFAEIDEILMPKFVKNLRRRVKVTYGVTVTIEEILKDPRRVGIFVQPENPEETACQHELAELVKDLLKRKILTQRERKALHLRFGIGCREHSTPEAARKMETSTSNVSSAVKSAFRKLRKHSKCACLKQFLK